MAPAGGIEAIHWESGKVLWRVEGDLKPLAVHGDRLVVLRDAAQRPRVLPIGVLDRGDGSKRSDDLEIDLPKGTRAMIDQGLGETFSLRAHEDQGGLVLSWRYLRQHTGGTSPGPDDGPFVRLEEASVRLNLEGGTFEHVATAGRTQPLEILRSIGVSPETGERVVAAWRVDKKVAAVTDRFAGTGKRRVMLRYWTATTGDPVREEVLFKGKSVAQLRSTDGRHLLVVSEIGDDPEQWERYLWTVFSLDSGEVVGTMRYHRSADHFTVAGSTLMHIARPVLRRGEDGWIEEVLRVRAVDLAEAAEIWDRPLRDTAYRGPLPPGQQRQRPPEGRDSQGRKDLKF